jgi:hypothetical protein
MPEAVRQGLGGSAAPSARRATLVATVTRVRSVVSPGPAHGLVDQAITGSDIWHHLAVELLVSGTPRHFRAPSISSVRSSRNPQANRTPW